MVNLNDQMMLRLILLTLIMNLINLRVMVLSALPESHVDPPDLCNTAQNLKNSASLCMKCNIISYSLTFGAYPGEPVSPLSPLGPEGP